MKEGAGTKKYILYSNHSSKLNIQNTKTPLHGRKLINNKICRIPSFKTSTNSRKCQGSDGNGIRNSQELPAPSVGTARDQEGHIKPKSIRKKTIHPKSPNKVYKGGRPRIDDK